MAAGVRRRRWCPLARITIRLVSNGSRVTVGYMRIYEESREAESVSRIARSRSIEGAILDVSPVESQLPGVAILREFTRGGLFLRNLRL